MNFCSFFIKSKIFFFSAEPFDLTWIEISLLESSCCNAILSGYTVKIFPKSAVQSSFDVVKLVASKFSIVTREVNIKISRKEKIRNLTYYDFIAYIIILEV